MLSPVLRHEPCDPSGVRDVNDVTAMVKAKVRRELLGLLMTG